MLPGADLKQLPPDDSYGACVRESHKVMFDTAEKAMAAAGIKPRQVRALTLTLGLDEAAARLPVSGSHARSAPPALPSLQALL